MIYRIEKALRAARRFLSRSEWAIRLLDLSRSANTATQPGLVLIQIDGLSQRQFRTALASGRLPYLQALIEKDGYREYALHSGLPSSTPAVQGELFYGVRCAVPAFSYRDRRSDAIVRMWDPPVADEIEQRLTERGTPLLEGGSAYCAIFSGGADEAHFCPSRMGWGHLLHGANPLALAILALFNLYSLLRASALMIVEFGLAVFDGLTGVIAGHDLVKELRFVPTRVAICILLRELVTIGAKIDVARGLPVVHVNYLGYDEQAHRRGPGSGFAHWALKGIDDSIARVARAAKRSARREYDVWIYSDHGQEACLPYPTVAGQSLEQAVSRSVARVLGHSNGVASEIRSEQTDRAQVLGRHRLRQSGPVADAASEEVPDQDVSVAAMGPLAHVYVNLTPDPEALEALGTDLISTASIPAVLAATADGEVRALTSGGAVPLPEEAARLLGDDHPRPEETARDLVDLCLHPDSGDLVLCGWRLNDRPISFPIENGAHGGPGPEETGAFVLLPGDVPLDARSGVHRPDDLHRAALHHLGRTGAAAARPAIAPVAPEDSLRIMTYNVHSCLGMDGKHTPERVVRLIAQYAPDILALQELDVGRMRTDHVDQAHMIAEMLEMELHFQPALQIEEELYGDAILSRLPMKVVRSGPLPGSGRVQPRGALWAEIATPHGALQFFNTHLGLTRRDRRFQIDALTGPDWLDHPDCRAPAILVGDLNAVPGSRTYKILAERMNDVQRSLDSFRPKPTFFGRRPTLRIDHIFVDPAIDVLSVEVPDGSLARAASDHLPIVADVRLPTARAPARDEAALEPVVALSS